MAMLVGHWPNPLVFAICLKPEFARGNALRENGLQQLLYDVLYFRENLEKFNSDMSVA